MTGGNDGFSLTVPASWFELDVRPATRDALARELVERRVREQPELWERRSELVRILRRQARDAWESGAIYCACFVIALDESVIPGALTVSVIPPPLGGATIDAISEELPTQEARDDSDTWMRRFLVDLPGIGRVPRSEGVIDVDVPGAGWVRTIVQRTFVTLDADRLLLISGASPALDLVEPLLELFAAVTSTLVLVPSSAAQKPAAAVGAAGTQAGVFLPNRTVS